MPVTAKSIIAGVWSKVKIGHRFQRLKIALCVLLSILSGFVVTSAGFRNKDKSHDT